ENVFDIVLNNGPWLIGFPVESSAVASGFSDTIRNFLPKDRRETIEAEAPRAYLNVSVQRHDVVPSTALSRDANIADDTANSPSRDKNANTFLPDSVKLDKEHFVIGNCSQLLFVWLVLFQCPIGR